MFVCDWNEQSLALKVKAALWMQCKLGLLEWKNIHQSASMALAMTMKLGNNCPSFILIQKDDHFL